MAAAPSLPKAAALLCLACLLHRTAADADSSISSGGGGSAASSHHHQHSDVQEFIPPKLSFTAADYFASLEEDGVVNSVQEHPENEGSDAGVAGGDMPWTIFQAVSLDANNNSNELNFLAQQKKAAVQRRSGPLLTLFPDTKNGNTKNNNNNNKRAKHSVLAPAEQRAYLEAHGKECDTSSVSVSSNSNANDNAILTRYDLLAKSPTLSNLATELWKYCTLYLEGGIYVDAETAPLTALGDVLTWEDHNGSARRNYAVVADTHDAGVSPSLLHGDSISDSVPKASSLGTGKPVAISSVLALGSKKHSVPSEMIAKLMDASTQELEEDALLLPRLLMELIENDERDNGGNKWGLLKQRCNGIEVAGGGGGSNNSNANDREEHRTIRHCPTSAGYCCEILDPESKYVFLLSRQALVPNQILPHSSTLPQPYNNNKDSTTTYTSSNAVLEKELAFMSTVRDDLSSPQLTTLPYSPGTSESTPNIYELLNSANALPNQEANGQKCMDCLRDKNSADCGSCKEQCPKFCERICDLKVEEKPVKRVLSVVGPRYRKDPERLIPRIVHQTWFEPVTPEKYPNMSRLIESWKRSGWEYHFWDDASAAEFLSLHFPPEVREAYDSILPGAFKADLFRYCVLLIQGGIYADMDVMLESNLDAAVPPDVGFMVPVDAPGIKPDHRMCLWNGFIASAPAHPYLSTVIGHVVNNIRNRFTVVDYDRMMCPHLELSVVHAFSTLFTAGPCILGLTVNEVMGRELQQTFVEGDLEKPIGGKANGVPGRTIILQQNKWDMGAHRFTWVENNLVVAATDMPDYDDRKDLEGEDEEQATHYSKTLVRNSLYGQDKVYVDREIAHEKIVMKTVQESPPVSSVA